MPAIRTKTDANADLHPASTSTDGKPASYDARLASSCVQCRARKIKCTSDKPLCANCIQSGQQCEYRHRLKPGLKQGVGSELLQRVSVLEEVLATVNSRMADFSTRLDRFDKLQHPSRADMALGPGSSGSASANMQYAAASSKTPASAASATSTGSVASINSTELMPPPLPSHYSHHGAHYGLDEDLTKHRSLGTASVSKEDPLAGKSGLLEANSKSVPDDLPPYDLLLTLLDLFFVHVAPWTPFVRRDVGEALRTASNNDHEWPILIYGIVVASLRFSFDPRWNDIESKDVYRERAKRRVIMHSMSSTSVASIEALMLVALDDVGANTTPAAWGALALTTRSAVHMSLHKEEMNAFRPSDVRGVSPMQLLNRSTSHAEAEERRRLFWSIFVLDRWSATATGWDLAFADEHISRQLPCIDSEWLTSSLRPTRLFVSPHQQLRSQSTQEEPKNADVELIALIEVTDLLGKLHQLHRERLDDVQKFREGTEAALPISLRMASQSNTHPRPILIQALYWATVIKLQSLVAYPLAPNLAPDPQAGEKAHEAAKQISYLARASTVSSAYLSWTFFVGARMMLLRAYRRNEMIDPAIQDTLRGLREAATYFDLAEFS
ncbi:BZ3500_MvSof-1268-A1-R1_Chr3-2g06220 [Microbotryum saponariae]|uniref:BZ3500_MvSof-1268-A1-R1_Chr3-2g06220 protein n=1 Tax=Microbotryum saponariae TaxID=289078 RepID=A0A2X0N0X5_9BASI|nr:BZ3500_MvSof-1268-A1-R1_Chr3-2g06220 [Microbotryum saponariae]SDA04139.1 BZ3501_MvSof-1269-A2-R1_Chr3-2g05911 [Microbotryum saponariae]